MSKKLAIAMFGQKRLSREGGVEIVVKELCTRMAQNGCDVTCYNRAGHHVSGAEYDDAGKTEYEGIRQKSVPTIERRGLAAVSSSAFAALYSAFGKYDVVHIHAEGPAFFAWLPKMFGKRVVVTVHGIDWQREKWQSGLGSKFIHQMCPVIGSSYGECMTAFAECSAGKHGKAAAFGQNTHISVHQRQMFVKLLSILQACNVHGFCL